jgi:molecular chaperone GrpE
MSGRRESPRGGKDDAEPRRPRPGEPVHAVACGLDAQPEAHQDRQTSTAELEVEIAALKDRLLRELAEQENIRMRARREREEAGELATGKFAKDLAGSLDDLARAIASFPEDLAGDSRLQEVLAGLKVTERGFLQEFERHGITRFYPIGESFDPNRHDALHLVKGSGRKPGTIAEVLVPGYLYRDRLLRPAKVSVESGS